MVIQARQPIVMMVMQQAVPCLYLPLTISFASPVPNTPRAPRRLARMPSGKREPDEAPHWEVLIQAIAADQDREAFARLFAYFAPRVKAFMQRSGVAADAAEELAQETMINVWRKADLFDAGTAAAAAWIFTIARNLRIDAYRRDQRGIDAIATEFEIELEPDDARQPDAAMIAKQDQTRIRSALQQLSPEQSRVV
jgi:RNA polymerase sigma-70 factor, ECF subfamily